MAAQVDMSADLNQAMVVLPSKVTVSRKAGMDNLPQAKDPMDTILQARDNMHSSQVDMVAQGSNSQVAMADHHQASLLTVDRRAAMGLLHLHRGTRLDPRLKINTENERDGGKKRKWAQSHRNY